MKPYRLVLSSVSIAAALFTSGYAKEATTPTAQQTVLSTYANLATANYNDALKDAKALEAAIAAFAKKPTDKSLQNAKQAWLDARESYGQTEIFRLSNGPIDAEDGWIAEAYGALEGQINAWPLDENMIDYTIDADGKRTSGNIIDTIGEFNPGGEDSKAIDVTTITKEALSELNENGGEANVSTGYHAIEFLLWGQDQDYSNFMKDGITKGEKTAGQRPITDFTTDK
ncbi:MAG: imelysin family protein, partial [Arcobacteraceae bacterium]